MADGWDVRRARLAPRRSVRPDSTPQGPKRVGLRLSKGRSRQGAKGLEESMQLRDRAILVSVRRLAICVVAAFAVACGGLPVAASVAGVIPTDRGPVRGIETPTEKEYLGIPYASPPVGDLRW